MSYIHVLEGRIRVRMPDIKGAPSKAYLAATRVSNLEGVEQVTASHVTGSLLILYDSTCTTHHHLLSVLRREGWLEVSSTQEHTEVQSHKNAGDRTATASGPFRDANRPRVLTLIEAAVRRLIIALI